MHDSISKIPSKKSRPYIYDVKFLALLGAPYIYIYMTLVGKGLMSRLFCVITIPYECSFLQRRRLSFALPHRTRFFMPSFQTGPTVSQSPNPYELPGMPTSLYITKWVNTLRRTQLIDILR
jgi:hypothetical protein